MANKKQYTIGQLCDDLTKAFGEDCSVAEEVAEENLAKLAARKQAGTIDGNGDGISGKERTK